MPSELRVRVGGVADPPDGLQAKAVIKFKGQRPYPTSVLPNVSSGYLTNQQWQGHSYQVDPSADADEVVSIDIIGHTPHFGTFPLATVAIPVKMVVQRQRVVLEECRQRCGGIGIELEWFDRETPSSEADILGGSGVRRVRSYKMPTFSFPLDEGFPISEYRLRGDGVGHEPTSWELPEGESPPMPPDPVTVGGMQPTTPPADGKRWVWGCKQWHEVLTDEALEAKERSEKARNRWADAAETIVEGFGSPDDRRAKDLLVASVEAFAEPPAASWPSPEPYA